MVFVQFRAGRASHSWDSYLQAPPSDFVLGIALIPTPTPLFLCHLGLLLSDFLLLIHPYFNYCLLNFMFCSIKTNNIVLPRLR